MPTIATWNVNSVGARLENVLAWLRAVGPDIVLLQEIKCPSEAFPRLAFVELGYEALAHGQKSYNGVAILAKAPILDPVQGLPGEPEDAQARYLEATVMGLRVASIYLPNGNPVGTERFDYKIRWMERLEARAAELLAEERAVVLAGDWNVVPEDRDVFSTRATQHDAVMQPEARQAWRRIVHQGWTDSLRALHPDEPKLYTFWDYTAGCWQRDLGFRLDHLLCSPEAADRLAGAGVDKWARAQEKASDHAPTWVELS
jgi:exodeoxyribonuclease III